MAALLLALNAFLVQYAQEARGYALATFLVALACFFYVRGAEGGRARDWVAYAAAMSLAFYAHLFAAFVLLAHAVTVALLPRRVTGFLSRFLSVARPGPRHPLRAAAQSPAIRRRVYSG